MSAIASYYLRPPTVPSSFTHTTDWSLCHQLYQYVLLSLFFLPSTPLTSSQTRRAVRVTRATALKDNENANARPSRIATRSKPPSTTGIAPAASGLGGVTRATAASRAKAIAGGDVKPDPTAVKRKREALGEVAVNNKSKPAATKGKEKENTKEAFDGVVLKTKPTTRQPLRTVGTKQVAKPAASRVTKKEKDVSLPPKEEEKSAPAKEEHAMAVDPPTIPSLIKRGSLPTKDARQPAKRLSTRESRSKAQVQPEEDDVEDHRDLKRRRTSSEAPEDPREAEEAVIAARIAAELEAYADEPEADPENSPWDDLDADDADDPLMVSEYVVDIFKYLRQVEVRFFFFSSHIFPG